jgi:hypothetical protein
VLRRRWQPTITSKLPWRNGADVYEAMQKPTSEPERPAPPPGVLEVCRDDGKICKRFRSPYAFGLQVNPLALDASGEHALLVSFEPTPPAARQTDGLHQEFADVIEIATGQRTVHIKLNHLSQDMSLGDATMGHTGEFVNRALLIGEWPAAPSGSVILVDPVHRKGRRVFGFDDGTFVNR